MNMAARVVKDGRGEARAWWNTPLFACLLVVVSAVPLLWPTVPPLLDVPGHMARYRVQLGLADSSWLQRYFDFHWAPVGNLGADLLVQAIAPVLGLESTVKLIAMSIPMLFVGGLLAIGREVHGRLPPTAAIAAPLAYSTPFLYGFLNFTLSVSLALFAFALWVRLARQGRLRLRAILFVPISLLLYFAHIYGWAVLGLLCLGAEVVRAHDERGHGWSTSVVDAALACAVLAAPLVPLLGAVRNAGGQPFDGWFDLELKLNWLVAVLRDRWKIFDVLSTMLCFTAMMFARIDPRLRFSRILGAGAVLLGLACLVLPFWMLNSALADMRLLPAALAIGILSIDNVDQSDRHFAGKVALVALLFFTVRTVGTTASFAMSANQQDEHLAQLDLLPRGARLATLVGRDCTNPWPSIRDGHLGSMVTVRRDGFSNDQWPGQGINLLHVRYRPPNGFASDPGQMVQPAECLQNRTVEQALQDLPRQWFDYVWLLGTETPSERQLRGLALVAHSPGASLYRIVR